RFEHGLGGPAVLRCGAEDAADAVFDPPPRGHNLLDEFARAAAGQSHSPQWADATRAAELAEWAWHSFQRRRSVDVYHEKRNELASFKGRMTSLGCGLIWLTLVLVLVVAAGKGLGVPGMDWVAAGAAALWVAFLALQGLRWVFPRE